MSPRYLIDLHCRYGVLLAKRGDYPAAVAQYEEALRRDPNQYEALLDLAGVLTEMRRYDEAAARYRQLLAREPANSVALRSLAHVLRAGGHPREGLAALTEAVRQAPNDASAAALLAWQLATSPDAELRDGPRALEVAQQAMQAAGRPNPTLLQALAAAYAECGRFEEAAATAEQVLEMARKAGRPQQAAWIEAQLAGYREKRPFRESE